MRVTKYCEDCGHETTGVPTHEETAADEKFCPDCGGRFMDEEEREKRHMLRSEHLEEERFEDDEECREFLKNPTFPAFGK
jgi:hypothetical protein